MSEKKLGFEFDISRHKKELEDAFDSLREPYSKGVREKNEKLLSSLGGEFNVCWDAWKEAGQGNLDQLPPTFLKEDKTFNEGAFFAAAEKLDSTYREYLKRVIAEKMSGIASAESSKQLTTEDRSEAMPGFAIDFIKKLEFFSRLEFPLVQIEAGGRTAQELENEIEKNEMTIDFFARPMLRSDRFPTSKESEQVYLTRLEVRDLGFPDDQSQNPSLEEVYEKAKEFGLELCRAEVGPAYRIAYKDQPKGESFFIAMEPLFYSGNIARVFVVSHWGQIELDAAAAGIPDTHYGPKARFIFRLPSEKNQGK